MVLSPDVPRADILRQKNSTAVTVPLLPVCRGGTKLMSSHPSLPAAVDVTLKTDGENEQSD